ncbi:MAG: cupin domain-containing protein [Ignavibacteria bacterium]|nr:cupin domain-containing protein [Ignavibacteria bacterium]
MVKRGDIIKDNTTGDIVEFLETARETGGSYTRIRFTVRPGGFRPVEHLHPSFDESFKVIRGILTVKLDGIMSKVNEGDEVTLPKGIPHTHYNDEQADLVMEQTFAPALDVELFLENLFGLSCDGRVKNGEPELLQVLVWLKKLKAKTYLAKLPVGLQDTLSAVLSPLAGVLGYRASYRKYSGVEF